MKDITNCIRETKLFSPFARAGVLFLCAAGLSGCMGNGPGLADASGVDRIRTSAVPASANPAMVDAAAVQTAVSTADVTDIAGNPVPWANAQSGSAGVISSIEEKTLGTTVCRRFTTTRHSYQGIAKFDGNACRAGDGPWTLTRFEPKS